MSHPSTRSQVSALNRVEIDAEALRSNLRTFRARLGPSVELAHVVKSNAYGHGLSLVAREDEATGLVDRLAVISVEELVRIREAGVSLPVLILGYVSPDAWDVVVEAEGSPTLMNRESVEALSLAAAARDREVPVTLKVETGTHRYGFAEDELLEVARLVDRLPGVRLEGLSTHFANIEDTTDHGFAREQLDRFRAVLERARAAGLDVPLPHAACSAAGILLPETHFGLARIGISAYGIWPSKETRVSARHEGLEIELRPVLSWKTRIGQINVVPVGGYVGYGCSWRAPVTTKLAVLPVGYADGYDRRLSNVGHVLIHGQRAPIRGRVCMNVTLVDVTHIPGAALEDEVVLLGAGGGERVGAEDLAGWCGTIPYEIVARISEHQPRIRV